MGCAQASSRVMKSVGERGHRDTPMLGGATPRAGLCVLPTLAITRRADLWLMKLSVRLLNSSGERAEGNLAVG